MHPTIVQMLADERSQRFIAEAERERLAAQAPRRPRFVFRVMSFLHAVEPAAGQVVAETDSDRSRATVPAPRDGSHDDRAAAGR